MSTFTASFDFDGDSPSQLRRLSTNSTGDIETGAVVAIALGGVAVLILIVGAAWWACFRQRGANMSTGMVAVKPSFQPFGFTEPADGHDLVELPLLRMGGTAVYADPPCAAYDGREDRI